MGKTFYFIFTLILTLALVLMFYTPYLAFLQDPIAPALYNYGFSWACHQKISRSICLFKNNEGGYSFADCIKQTGVYVPNDNKQLSILDERGFLGYKLPVCARDVGIYTALLLGMLIYPFVRKINDKGVPPGIFLLLALIPMGLDGGIQLLSELGLSLFGNYESTNAIRLVTGAIAGFILPFYIMPLYHHYRSKK